MGFDEVGLDEMVIKQYFLWLVSDFCINGFFFSFIQMSMIVQVIHVRIKVTVSTEITHIRVNAPWDGKDLLAKLVSNWWKHNPEAKVNIMSVGVLSKVQE